MRLDSLSWSFGATLPSWLADEIADVDPSLEARMAVVLRLAERNYREGTGGPFAAMVVDGTTGEVISVGVNLVLASELSSAHAEVVAISLAHAKLGSWNLAATSHAPVELVVNWRPCVMCYGATMWAGIERLVIAGEGGELEKLTGFDDGPMRDDWQAQFEQRGIQVITDVLRDDALAVFGRYGSSPDRIVYNARQQS
jgi:tRNA(Arg) A34 adenosine deaminase TadA